MPLVLLRVARSEGRCEGDADGEDVRALLMLTGIGFTGALGAGLGEWILSARSTSLVGQRSVPARHHVVISRAGSGRAPCRSAAARAASAVRGRRANRPGRQPPAGTLEPAAGRHRRRGRPGGAPSSSTLFPESPATPTLRRPHWQPSRLPRAGPARARLGTPPAGRRHPQRRVRRRLRRLLRRRATARAWRSPRWPSRPSPTPTTSAASVPGGAPVARSSPADPDSYPAAVPLVRRCAMSGGTTESGSRSRPTAAETPTMLV